MQHDGLFIALEGTDGSGKDTQAMLLKQHLEKAGYDVVQLNFPRHGKSAAYFVDQYQQGLYGSGIQVGAYTACLFYALDYYDAAPMIRKSLADGKAVIATRFGASNMANQGAKITHPEERRGFFIWLDNLQFRMLNMPRPTMSFVLRVPPAVAQERVRQKRDLSAEQSTEAGQLAELDQLQLAANVYDDMCQLFPKDFTRVDCARGSTLLDAEQIHDLIWGKVSPLVPEPEPEVTVAVPTAAATTVQPTKTANVSLLAAIRSNTSALVLSTDQKTPTVYTPATLNGKTKELYEQRISQLLDLYAKIAGKLGGDQSARLVLPAATLVSVTTEQPVPELTSTSKQANLATLAAELQKNYSDESKVLDLTSYWPRNELDIVPSILYEYSNQSFDEIQYTVSGWPYDKKSFVLRSYVREPASSKQALESVFYNWDVLTELQTIAELRTLSLTRLDWQLLSPRLGYDIPSQIEQAGLADDFEHCFDLSLELYSSLQAAGYIQEAQYATLLGHRVRARLTTSASDLAQLYAYAANHAANSSISRFASALFSQVAGVHPLLGSTFQTVQPGPPKGPSKPTASTPRSKRPPKRAGSKPPLDK